MLSLPLHLKTTLQTHRILASSVEGSPQSVLGVLPPLSALLKAFQDHGRPLDNDKIGMRKGWATRWCGGTFEKDVPRSAKRKKDNTSQSFPRSPPDVPSRSPSLPLVTSPFRLSLRAHRLHNHSLDGSSRECAGQGLGGGTVRISV